ncbi:MAG: FMN-binding protein, partial [Peptoniphilus sp.]|uniref:FMN-binding protein n=1 Tax=Peptoniphilus sp. TaxID=1971214 RepID=UPI002A757148
TGIEKIEPSEKATRETAFVALSNGLEKIEKKTNTNKEEAKKTEDKNRSGFNYRTINIVGYDGPRDNRSSNTDTRPAKPLNPTTPTTPKNPVAPQCHLPKEDVKYADGTWYGIAKENYDNNTRGEDLVKIKIKDNKIVGADIPYTTEDSAVGSKEINGKRILGLYFGDTDKDFKVPKEINLNSLKEVQQYLQDKYGKNLKEKNSKYDAITNATVSARSYLLGVEHALKRAAKYAKDNIEQKIAFIKVEDRVNAMSSGKLFYNVPINLDHLKFEVWMTDGKILNNQSLKDLEKLGVTCNYKNGDIIKHKDESGKITVKLVQESSLTEQEFGIAVTEVPKEKDRPTHILLTYKDGKQEKFDIVKGEFRYPLDKETLEIKNLIEKVELYNGEKLLKEAEPRFQGNTTRYLMDVGNKWEFPTYRLDTYSEYGSEVKSFEVKPIKKEYAGGEVFRDRDLQIEVKFLSGEEKVLPLVEAKKLGFKTEPIIGDKLEKDTKEIIVIYKDKREKYDIKVTDEENLIPRKVVFKDRENNEIVKIFSWREEEWNKRNGKIVKREEILPIKYKDAKLSDLDIEVYNEKEKKIDILDIDNSYYRKNPYGQGIMQLSFKTKYKDEINYLMASFEFKDLINDKVPKEVDTEDNKKNEIGKRIVKSGEYFGEALCEDVIQDFKFIQKVKVVVGANGLIEEVTDNKTERGTKNDPYWAMYNVVGKGLEKYKGKDLDGVKAMKTGKGEPDSVSSATVTSQSVQQAVINALSKTQNK